MEKEVIDYTWAQLGNDVAVLNMMMGNTMNESGYNYFPDYVVGILRGGMIPAIMLSHKLNVPIIPLQWSLRDHKAQDLFAMNDIIHLLINRKNVLIVDDIVDSGATLKSIQAKIENAEHVKETVFTGLKYAALLTNNEHIGLVDYTAGTINRKNDKRWVVFPWEYR